MRAWWLFPESLIWRSNIAFVQLCVIVDLQFVGGVLPVYFSKFLNNKFFWFYMCGFHGKLLVACDVMLLSQFGFTLTTLISVFQVLIPSSSIVIPRSASVPWLVVFSSRWRCRQWFGVAHKLPVVGENILATFSMGGWAPVITVVG